jgi:hypothetical protein
MSSDQERSRNSLARHPSDEIRHRVVEAVHEAKSPGQLTNHAELDLYLALLLDRLPVYVGASTDLMANVGRASVEANLFWVGIATIDFYGGVLAAKVSVIARQAQLVRLREVMRPRELGPGRAADAIADYLREEQKTGRVAADVEPLAAAHLLVGGCLNYAFTRMLEGDGEVPSREEYVTDIVRGLRLSTENQR